jgi:hypothetical protein
MTSDTSESNEIKASGSDGMPLWLDDSHIDIEWLKSKSSKPIKAKTCSVQDISNQGRLGSTPQDGATLLLTLNDDDADDDVQFVIKQIPLNGAALSRQLGLAREALFYKDLAPMLLENDSSSSLPAVYYSYGNTETGEKVILMEALASKEWLDSGIFFGPGNPNNWKRNLPEMIKTACGTVDQAPSAATVAKTTFIAVARTHASFWKQPSLLDSSKNWLRGQEWLQGKGKDSWEASQQLVRGMWTQYNNKKEEEENDGIKWDPTVRASVNKAVAGISWQAQLDRLNVNGRWTLVHGDFWPGNVMWNINDPKSIRLLDWEMVGLGSGTSGKRVFSFLNIIC